jgi:hypothetical protein
MSDVNALVATSNKRKSCDDVDDTDAQTTSKRLKVLANLEVIHESVSLPCPND